MKHVKLAASALVLASLFSTATYASPSFKGDFKGEAMPVMPSYFSWTGFYVGANLGGIGYSQYVTDIDEADFDSTIHLDSDVKWSGGLQLGWRYQVDCALASGVFGIEGSADWTNAKYNKTFGVSDYEIKTELKNIWMIQAMGGIAAGRSLLFLGVGAAWADVDGSWTDLAGDTTREFSTNRTAVGPVVSAGVEYAFTDMISVRVKVDDFMSKHYSNSDGNGNSYLSTNNIVQGTIGLNVKFA